MKYCLFDGGDVVGPFSAQELLSRAGFGAHCLVCPQEHSEEESYWKEARFYEDFGFSSSADAKPAPPVQESAPPAEGFLNEMNHAATEFSAFTVQENALPSAPASTSNVPPTPAASEAADKAEPVPSSVQEQVPADSKPEKKNKLSSILLRASEEMKRQRVARAAASEAEEQQKANAKTSVHRSSVLPSEQKENEISVPAQSPLSGDDSKSQVVQQTVSKLSPIEEYFDTIKSGDLGRILGIPGPNENSDLNLARALESQFEKTDPGTGKLMDEDPFDEFTPQQSPTQSGQELLDEILPEEADKKTEENLNRSLPDLEDAQSLSVTGEKKAKPSEGAADSAAVQEVVVSAQADDDPNDKTVKTILEGKLKVDTLRQEIPEPIKEVPPETANQPHSHAAQMAREYTRQHAQEERQNKSGAKFLFLGLGAVVLLAGAYLNWVHQSAADETAPSVSDAAVGAEAEPAPQPQVPDAKEVLRVQPPVSEVDPLELAKQIVQNYQLDKGRGTVEQYLNKRYSKQLQQGYAAMWSAELLHKDSYVVKYRLAKTRKEPIVYIFQADTAKKKLTGALNNITLDLVGKIS